MLLFKCYLLFPCYLHFFNCQLLFWSHILCFFSSFRDFIEICQVFANSVQQVIVLGMQEGFKNNISINVIHHTDGLKEKFFT